MWVMGIPMCVWEWYECMKEREGGGRGLAFEVDNVFCDNSQTTWLDQEGLPKTLLSAGSTLSSAAKGSSSSSESTCRIDWVRGRERKQRKREREREREEEEEESRERECERERRKQRKRGGREGEREMTAYASIANL